MGRLGETRGAALISYASVFFSIAAGLVYTPWMIRTIGQADYGLYTLATSLISLFLMDFGLGSAVARFLSGYYAEGRHGDAANFLGVVYRFYLIIAGVVALVLVGAYFFLGKIYVELSHAELNTLKSLYVIVATYSVISFPLLPINGVLLAAERLVSLRLTSLSEKVVTVVLTVGALLLGWGVVGLVAMNAISNLGFAWLRYGIARRIPGSAANMAHKDRGLVRRILGFSGWVTVSQLAQRMIFNISPTVLAAVSGAREIAVFGLAAALEGYVFAFTSALRGMFLPRVSRLLVGKDSSQRMLDLMVSVGRLQLYVVGLMVIGFASVGREFVSVWLGEQYGVVYTAGLLLMAPALVEAPQEIAATAVTASDKVRLQAYTYVVMAVLNLVLLGVLAPRLGALGASLSICIAYLARTGMMSAVYSRALQIDMMAYFRRTYGSWLVPAALSLASGIATAILTAGNGWMGVLAGTLVTALVYASSMMLLSFNDYEKGLLRDALAGFRRR